MLQGNFKILSNKKAGAEYFKMCVCAPEIARRAQPGQFIHLRCRNSTEPLLRRPFSFHRIHGDNFEVLYKVIGRGTNLLAKKQKGDKIDVLGPLGNGFNCQLPFIGYQLPVSILVAGGMGVAPLFALAENIVHSGKKRIYVLIGATAKKHLLCEKEFRNLGVKVLTATDDGSKGHKGFVTDLLKNLLLSTVNSELATIYTCGPKPMLEAVARIARRYHIAAQGSLEENMACGVGACCGCVVETKQGYRQVCNDGPVFNLQEIKW
jgi:dihydroorotate dehydrogenase electron transfer subunit